MAGALRVSRKPGIFEGQSSGILDAMCFTVTHITAWMDYSFGMTTGSDDFRLRQNDSAANQT